MKASLITALFACTLGCSQSSPRSSADAREVEHDRVVEGLADATQVLDEMNEISARSR